MTLFAAAALLAPTMVVDYRSFSGLSASVMDIPILTSSSFQLFDAASGKGLYSSRWSPQSVDTGPNGARTVRFLALEGKFAGTHELARTPEGFDVKYRFTWRGEKPARLNNSLGVVWSSCFADGLARFDGGTEWPLGRPMAGDREARRVGQPARRIELEGSAIRLSLSTSPPMRLSLMDGRGAPESWGQGRGSLWLGQESVALAPGSTVEFTAHWRIEAPGRVRPMPREAKAVRTRLDRAAEAEARPLPLVPAPRERVRHSGWLAMGPSLAGEGSDVAMRALRARWALEGQAGGPASLDAKVRPLGLPAEAFEVQVGSEGVRVSGQDEAGLRHGLVALAALAEVRDGQVGWAHQTVRDWPSVRWRGVHMFVGPEARSFQAELMDKVVAPLRFDRAVLQCERTAWECMKGSEPPQSMAKQELAALFDDWRARGIEPIPLVQSLGHMEWFFAGGSRKELALNPDVPYTLDLRKEPARAAIAEVWREAVEATRAKTVHFGLDEFGNRGRRSEPGLETRLWKAALPYLDGLAKELGVAPMAWGDAMLGPGEAGSAAHAPSDEEAAQRRAAVPARWRIADWRYAAERDPAYYRSLALFRGRGHPTVAASWEQPQNVAGHTLAAIAAGAGTLQTTWAGYVSEEAGAHRHLGQFAAYVLAGAASWSGKPLEGVDSKEWFARAFWGAPFHPAAREGAALSVGPLEDEVRAGAFHGVAAGGLELHTPLCRTGREAPSPIRLACDGEGSELAVFADCVGWLGEGDPAAAVRATFEDGTTAEGVLRYGSHVRARDDARPAFALGSSKGLGLFRLRFGGLRRVKAIELDSLGTMAGVRFRAMTLVR